MASPRQKNAKNNGAMMEVGNRNGNGTAGAVAAGFGL